MLPNNLSGKLILQRLTAADPKTPGDQLVSLAHIVTDVSILTYIAGNKNCPKEVLAHLANHESAEVRIAVGENFSTPEYVLAELAVDEDVDVRFNLADNCNLPKKILEILIKDENPWVAWRARKSIGNYPEEVVPLNVYELRKDKRIRTLIAEDNVFIRTLIIKSLNEDPQIKTICGTSDGKTTVQECLNLKPDIVLMDIKMPGLNGLEATRKIKEASPDTKIIMVTGSDWEEDIACAFKAGANGYFLKSTPFDQLPACIKAVFDNAIWLDPGISSTVLKQCFGKDPVEIQKIPCIDYENTLKSLYFQIEDSISNHEYDEAVVFCEAAIKLSEKVYGLQSRETAFAMATLADIYYFNRDYRESEFMLLKAIENNDSLLNHADNDTDFVITCLAQSAELNGQLQQAELYYTWSLRIRERIGDQEKIDQVNEKLKILNS